MSCLLIALQVAHLNLEQGQVPQDLQIVFVPLESIAIAFDCFGILLIRPLEQAEHVPTNVRTEVVGETPADMVVGLLFAAKAIEDEALHGLCLAVLRKLGIAENLFGELEAIFVLFLFVTF
jgi:hypothetical protein